jgi:dual specificity MAP kinase phosphatase
MLKIPNRLYSFILVISVNLQRIGNYIWAIFTQAPPLYKSQITEHLFLGGQFSEKGLQRLKEWNITGVISLREVKPRLYTNVPWLKTLHLPTRDRQAPAIEDLKTGVGFINKQIKKGGKVYVHCMWGEGRGPTMAAAYLISQGMTPNDAISQIQMIRTFIRITKKQKKQLEEFALLYPEIEKKGNNK